MSRREPAKNAVLYVRVEPKLLETLDEHVTEERERTGYKLSRADVVRRLLGETLGLHRGKGRPR